MDETSYSSTTSKLWMNPFKDETNITALKKIEELISASIGPHGKLICIGHVSGGSATITSSSQRLFSLISIQNILLKLIVSSAKLHLNSFNNDGLCCALLILKLIKNSLYVDYPLPVIGKLVEYFGNLFIEHLNMDKNACVQKIDLSNLTYIQSIVLSILASKPGSVLREEDKQYLCILLIKVFLNCVPSSSSDNNYRNINLITLESVCCDQSNLYEGLLVRLPEFSQKIHSQLYSNSSIKVVLYTSSLAGDADFPVDKIEVTDDVNVWETVLNEMKSAVEKLIRTGIHILACQKVVHPSLRKLLEDSNILVLDRLGFEVAKHLEYILGTSNTSLFEEPSFGYLTSIHQITIGKKSFLLLSKEAKSFWTMLICNFNEQAVNETKVVCQQAIDTLIHLLKKHFVCYGAGCTEIHTIKLVVQKVFQTLDDIQHEIGCKISEIFAALQIFEKSILDLAVAFHQGSTLNVATEASYGHLWKLNNENFPSGNDRCLCGQFSADTVDSSRWKMFTKSTYQTPGMVDAFSVESIKKLHKSVILDELSSKVNAYMLAFQTVSSLLRVSVLVSS